LIIVFFAKLNYSQSIQFSQFYSAPLTLAPSFTGATEKGRFIVNFRDQWPSIKGTYTTFATSYDQYFSKIKSGMGISIMRDQAGSGNLALTEVGVSYSWEGKITNSNGGWYFKPGISFKMSQLSLNFPKLIFGDQITSDGTSPVSIETPTAPSKSYLDAATSIIVYNSDFFWGGISVDHLFKPNQSLYYEEGTRLPMKTSVFVGYKINVGQAQKRSQYDKDQESVTFTAHYRYFKPYDQLDFGAYWVHDPFTLGAWIRGLPITSKSVLASTKRFDNFDAVVFLVGYKIFDLHIGYSYDLTISNLIGNTGGAHEISIIYEFDANVKTKNKHATIPCPKF